MMKLPGKISAVRIAENARGGKKAGGLSQLEPGTLLELCGDGYNDRTVKVRVCEELFYVFRQDLQL